MRSDYIEEIRRQTPLVHCITNAVTVNGCANLLLAAGASPTMAHHPKEVAEITAACKALVCNLGATESFDAMLIAAEESARHHHPVIVDPVGAGGSSFRREYFRELSAKAEISCIRGNYAEITALARDGGTVTGVDAGAYDGEEAAGAAVALAKRTGAVVIASGAVDYVTDGQELYRVENGTAEMSRITGSGCMATALLGAYFAVDMPDADSGWRMNRAAAAMAAMGICGEYASERCGSEQSGTMSFYMHLVDKMSMLTGREFLEKEKIFPCILKKS